MTTIGRFSSRFLGIFLYKSRTLNSCNLRKVQNNNLIFRRYLSSTTSTVNSNWDFVNLDQAIYEKVCSETLESLCDYFEELVEKQNHLEAADITYGDGVLTVKFGQPYGTYVINRQSPNKQIWLSSPTTGPKRYDFLGCENAETGKWIYKHNNESLHALLQREIKDIIKNDVDFYQLPYASA